jgi:outer membrane protein TolC
MNKTLVCVLTLLIAAAALPARAAAPELTLSLDTAEDQALNFSPALKAKRFEASAAQARADMTGSMLWPRLTLEGSWRYLSVVPELTAVPGRPPVPLGDHPNYSIGPMLSWNFWDSGGLYAQGRSLEAAARAKQQEALLVERTLRLRTRLVYFQAQLAAEQVRLVGNALKVGQVQYQDIRNQLAAGASSRIDSLSFHQEVINRQRDLRQARTGFTLALRELFSVTGQGQGLDPSLPLAADQVRDLPAGEAPPTLLLTLDPLERSLARLAGAERSRLDPEYPQLVALALLEESQRQAAAAAFTGHYPKLQAMVKSSLDYPNGPVQESIQQNTFGVAGTLSLFEFGRIMHQVEEPERLALASAQQRAQTLQDLTLAWDRSGDLLAELRSVQELDVLAVRETESLKRMVYDSYRAGRATYLEVQTADLRFLTAQIQAVRTQVQMLIQLATRDSLAVPPEGGGGPVK